MEHKSTQEAAEKGDAEAQYNLGLQHEKVQDYVLAVVWFQKAVKQGHSKAEEYSTASLEKKIVGAFTKPKFYPFR
jgi:TPR repeat protein